MSGLRKGRLVARPISDEYQTNAALRYAKIGSIQQIDPRLPTTLKKVVPDASERTPRNAIRTARRKQAAYILKHQPTSIDFSRNSEIVIDQATAWIIKPSL